MTRRQLLTSATAAVVLAGIVIGSVCAQRLGGAIPAVGAALACPLVIAIALSSFEVEIAAQPVLTRASRHRR